MDISHESPNETEQRLRRVIATADLYVFPDDYTFVERDIESFPADLASQALALVRDRDVWSALVPAQEITVERFVVFRFHFERGLDNSGFVGWLATYLKRSLGTGVFVVCGWNLDRGGIFDYWGAPASLRADVLRELRSLRSE